MTRPTPTNPTATFGPPMPRPRRGLTLIELVIILVIIAILVAIVLPRLRPRATPPAASRTDTAGAPAVRADTGAPAVRADTGTRAPR